MNRGVSFEVEDFSPSKEPSIVIPSPPFYEPSLRPVIKNWSRTWGLLGTFALHGVVSLFFLHGATAHPPKPPPPQGAGVSAATPAEELVLLTLTSSAKGDSDLSEQINSLGAGLETPPMQAVSPGSLATFDLPPDDESAAAGSPNPGDAAERALMFGRYTGQISARIERAWVRPRTPILDSEQAAARTSPNSVVESGTFTCRVQIRQDARGNVQEVLLLNCPGTEAWRHSLVVAIDQASPLPAPPMPSVFSRALTMTFEAHSYHPGDPPDAYELDAHDGVALDIDSTRSDPLAVKASALRSDEAPIVISDSRAN